MYRYVFTLFHFKTVFLNTVIFSVGSVALMVPIGFAIALLMNQRGIKGKRAFRTAILFPWAFPAFITILIWAGMLDYNFGIIDELFRVIGLKSVDWLTNPSLAMLSAILVNLWLSFPYYTFVYTATIQSIPSELNEAAEMDGYGLFGRLRRVVIPLVSRQIAFITIFGFIFTWNNFYVIYLLTDGGPGISTSTLMVYSYIQAFSDGNYSIAAAYSIISLLILLVFVVIANKYTKMMQVLY
ncbi:MAG: sugar ABC transporter permease [Candidatus Thermoplasmatota archaeon]|nr:sugar ABC transporter permease [Candidatus Thermoplasmatota archaeon]MCL5989133.1 sugar ABC transporter permease [Candidatus Thermoplasmatota archaeon]